MDKVIEQKHYPQIEIDDTEKDIVQYWQRGKEDVNVLQVERDKLHLLLSTTPATSWEEVERLCGTYCKQKVDEGEFGELKMQEYELCGHMHDMIFDYLSQHWPSSQPVSPTPMAEININDNVRLVNPETCRQLGYSVSGVCDGRIAKVREIHQTLEYYELKVMDENGDFFNVPLDCIELIEPIPAPSLHQVDRWGAFYERYRKWTHTTFDNNNVPHGIEKLKEEFNELQQDPTDILEYADVLMCLLYTYSCQFPDKPLSYLLEIATGKLAVNENSKWIRQENGTWKRVKPPLPAAPETDKTT